jgi:3-dehydroquinate synthase
VSTFRIQDTEFTLAPPDLMTELHVQSSPRPYAVEFASRTPLPQVLSDFVATQSHLLVLADELVLDAYRDELAGLHDVATMAVPATEEFKSVEGALSVVDFMDTQRMSRSSMLLVIGGGIIQDVGAFAACVYKRGVPWTYVPTTLLAQADSCIGAKSGLNHKRAKNVVGVFSAPRRILLHTHFLRSLGPDDLLSGLGEIFRLSIIGGAERLGLFSELEDDAIAGDLDAVERLTASALTVKQAVVERDEFELDLRRSMNFGHSVGHALEALTNHAIPHGIGVTIGVLVESEISRQRGLLSPQDFAQLLEIAGPIVPDHVRTLLSQTSLSDILDILFRDKKVEGSNLKLVVPESIGQIRFVDLKLEAETVPVLEGALSTVLSAL